MTGSTVFEEAAAYAGRRVLVTGALGFVGSHLLAALHGSGADVRALASPRSHAERRRAGDLAALGDIDWVAGDMNDEAVSERAALGREVVFNLAGSADAAAGDERPLADLEANARAHLVLLEACRRAAPGAAVVLASSRLVYAPDAPPPVPESAPLRPAQVYGVHKLAAEHYHLLYARRHGLPTVVLRLTSTYGPVPPPGRRHHGVVNAFLARAARGEPLVVHGGGAQLRDLVHVSDAVRAFLAAGARPPADEPVLNVGGGAARSLLAVAETIARLAGVPVLRQPMPAGAAPVGDFVADVRRIRSALGWRPLIGLDEGLAAALGRPMRD